MNLQVQPASGTNNARRRFMGALFGAGIGTLTGISAGEAIPTRRQADDLHPAFCHDCGRHSFAKQLTCPSCGSEDYSIWGVPREVMDAGPDAVLKSLKGP